MGLKLKIILGIIFTLSIIINIFLLFKKDIYFINQNDMRQDQRQYQYQGQLQFNMWMAQGDTIKWEGFYTKNIDEIIDKLNQLPPQYSYFSKIIYTDTGLYILIPKFMKESEIKK